MREDRPFLKYVRAALLFYANNRGRAEFAAEQGIAQNEALEKGLKEKAKAFAEKGTSVYAKAWRRRVSNSISVVRKIELARAFRTCGQ